MLLQDDGVAARLSQWLGDAAGGPCQLLSASLLGGGAIQENWSIEARFSDGQFAGTQALVLRTDASSTVAVSHSRADEFALLEAAFDAGVTVPEPLFLCRDAAVIGRPFYVMRKAEGTAVGQIIVKSPELGGDRSALTRRLGTELARIHSITPPTRAFAFLGSPAEDPAKTELEMFRRHLEAVGTPQPGIEWGLRWLALHLPPPGDVVLAHHDFRTGNYMVDGDGLTAVLDWEFAGWSDPHEDIGWFCAACWRFGRRDLEAGGIGSRADFYAGYEAESGRRVDTDRVFFWEVFAHVRWAVIALQQAARFLVDGEQNLDLALTGRRPPEMEWEILTMTGPSLAGKA